MWQRLRFPPKSGSLKTKATGTHLQKSGSGTPSLSITGRANRADGVLQHALAARTGINVGIGMRVLAGGRVYSIRELAARSIVLDPQRPVANGLVTPATTIEARLEGTEHPDSAFTREFYGPWSMRWTEA